MRLLEKTRKRKMRKKIQPLRVCAGNFEGVVVDLLIDHDAILQWLGPKAAKSRGGKAQHMRGYVVAKRRPRTR